MRIELKNREIVINGKPELIMAGEIHYFRLKKSTWQDRLTKLKEAGFNTVATYVPWLMHEEEEGEIDLTGRKKEELDLVSFIDLAKENGLYFIIRPGPFIMAEMKNEGLPYWLYQKYPEIVPVCWDNRVAPTKTVDYLHPNFLFEVKRWYKEVMEVIKPRLINNGGNIIALQLDNEIGMLSWVSNCPDLTDNLLTDFTSWLKQRYSETELLKRYFFLNSSFSTIINQFRSPKEEYSLEYLHDLGYYMRERFAKYVMILRSYAEEFGVKEILFLVNIHGTGGGRGLTFPIGISQLFKAYTQDNGYLAGSDIYFGDLDMRTFQDFYLINTLMEAVNLPNQPLSSLEFNCGDGNFGNNFSERYDPSAVDFKTRISIAQGMRLINFYLFAGGYNGRLQNRVNDGNNRIAFTGERHGFAAPINPEGKYNYTFPRMQRVVKQVMALKEKLVKMEEERDNLIYAFIPDYFMTEYYYPNNKRSIDLVRNLEMHRAGNVWEVPVRAFLLNGYRFSALDIQNKKLNLNKNQILFLPSARYMAKSIQEKLVEYLQNGGKIFLYGEIPLYDMEGKSCTIFKEALNIKKVNFYREEQDFYLSIEPVGWAKGKAEIRTSSAQGYQVAQAEPFLRIYGTEDICGFHKNVGKGEIIALTTSYENDLDFFQTILTKLGIERTLWHDYPEHGIFLTSTVNQEQERFLHLINLDGLDKEFYLYDKGIKLFNGKKFLLQSKDGVMLPLNLSLNGIKIVYSTAEIKEIEQERIVFRLTQKEDLILIATKRKIAENEDYTIQEVKEGFLITSKKHAKVDDELTIYFV